MGGGLKGAGRGLWICAFTVRICALYTLYRGGRRDPARSPPTPHRLWSFSQLSEWWLKTAYLQYRQPLVIYSSPGVALPKQDFVDLQGQLR